MQLHQQHLLLILGQVSRIEPIWSNCYAKDIAKVKTTIKNTYLEELLEQKGKNDKETWKSIRIWTGLFSI